MKLKNGFITHTVDGSQIMVEVGENAAFHGLARSNRTAAMIIDLLKEETTPEKIIDVLAARFDAPTERIAGDVEMILEKLRSIGAIDE